MISLKPSKIRFMHDRINNKFRGGISVNDTIDKIATGRMSIHTLPRIRVCRKDGFYYAFDNRRLYVYRVLQKRNKLDKITVNLASKSQFQPSRFNTLNNGKSVTMRGNLALDHAHATSPASSDDEDDGPTLSSQTVEQERSNSCSTNGLLSGASAMQSRSPRWVPAAVVKGSPRYISPEYGNPGETTFTLSSTADKVPDPSPVDEVPDLSTPIATEDSSLSLISNQGHTLRRSQRRRQPPLRYGWS